MAIYLRSEVMKPAFKTFCSLLVPKNGWAKHAGALILVISRTLFEYDGSNARTHSFDAGAATENMALQAFSMGLAMRGMEGFDYERARKELKVPQEYAIEALFAVGYKAPDEQLEEKYRLKDQPTERKPLDELVFNGEFGNP